MLEEALQQRGGSARIDMVEAHRNGGLPVIFRQMTARGGNARHARQAMAASQTTTSQNTPYHS
jgi:hypothetical protein